MISLSTLSASLSAVSAVGALNASVSAAQSAPDPTSPLVFSLLLVVGLLCGVINTLAGGGSVLSLPALILLGLPPHAANATNRVAGVTQMLSALVAFWRKGMFKGQPLLMLLLIAPLGGVLGARLSLLLTPTQMSLSIQACLASIAAFTLLAPKRLLEGPPPPPRARAWQLAWGTLAALYGGFLQAGIGLVSLYYLRFVCGYDLVRATTLKVVLISGITIPSLVTFIYYGNVRWWSALALSIGGLLGALLGAHLSLKSEGALIIRRALPIAALLMVLKLAWKTLSA